MKFVFHANWNSHRSSLPRERMLTVIYDGLRFTAMSSEIKTTIARGALFGLASTSVLALLSLIARDHLDTNALGFGILMGGFGAGAFIGGLSNPWFRRMITQERLIVLACFGLAACPFVLASSSSLAIAAVSLAVGGVGWVTAWSGFDVYVQFASPRWIMGRTISIDNELTNGGIAAGSWICGTVAQDHSLMLALTLLDRRHPDCSSTGFKLPTSNRSVSELEPSGNYCAPAIALDLKPRSGPILVTTASL
ncbi:MFS transporter [Ensifer sp. BR816]|uniref:MFS transporter n=1 Tax=Rhizobium sp. (strain BR816) TaxID=1057002 RepID=UPI00039F1E6B|nr:MFS transporter [Ensifer sp. BR816]